jgi:ATP-binding cassette subfamily F protein 3
LADKIFEFRDGKVREFLGNIDEYLEARKLDDFRQLEKTKTAEEAKPKAEKSDNSGLSYNERKQLDKDIRKAEREVKSLEQSIEKEETKIEEIDSKLHDPEQFKELSKEADFYEKYEARKVLLEKLMRDWEKAQEHLLNLEAKKEA